ncbi:MAG: orotate phosphoribosyltransferase [Bdellovibrionales bacterium]
MTRKDLASSIYKESYLKGKFKLRSGKESNEYFDKYRFEAAPELLREIAKKMTPLIPKDIQLLAGLELGGVPIATALSLETGMPLIFVRKKAKDYGTMKLAEGSEFSGKKICIIEDVVTTGGQVIESVKELRALGAEVAHVLCVIDREQGGRDKLQEHGLWLQPLFKMSELKQSL